MTKAAMTRQNCRSLAFALGAAAIVLPAVVSADVLRAGNPAQSGVTHRLDADADITLPGGARFVAPGGWSSRPVEGGVVLTAPEAGSDIAIMGRGETDPAAAVAAAWAVYRPGLVRSGEGQERPAREGWDRTFRFQFASPDDEPRTVLALALGKGAGWTVLLYDVSAAVEERRDAQIEVIFNSLLPQGYARETFAGRKAHRLDQKRIAQLAEMIETARREYGIPGVALGLVQDGRVVFAGGFGVREVGGSEPVDANTLFNVASIGKPWTTLMLAKQVADGRFFWDSPVHTLWPEFALGNDATTNAVRVRHLICACTGMPRNDYGWLFEGENSTPRSIMATLAQSQPTSTFGDTYQYSNLMAAAGGFFGGHMLFPEMELGAAYDRAMQELVFDPLKMTATTADFDRALAGNFAAGHALDVDGKVTVASQGLNLASISTRPSGNHWSNVSDILKYVQMELTGGLLPDGARYIDEGALRARAMPQVTEGLNEHYGMGLKIDRQWGVTVIHHGGSAAGYRSHMMWLPDHDVGAVILINSDTGGVLRSAFRRRLLELLFDGEPKAEADLARFAVLDREAVAGERASLTVPADPAAVASLARAYRSKDLGDLRVYEDRGRTWFDFGGWQSEVATFTGEGGSAAFVTISPGMRGYVFEPASRRGQRVLVTREAQSSYSFEEVR